MSYPTTTDQEESDKSPEKPKIKECKHPTCGDTCRREKSKKKVYYLKRSRPSKVSSTMAKLLEIYKPLSRQFILDHPFCEIKAPGCTKFTEGVNHKKGKTGRDTDGTPLLIKVDFFEGACNWCNGFCESHHQWAFDNGHRISKFEK